MIYTNDQNMLGAKIQNVTIHKSVVDNEGLIDKGNSPACSLWLNTLCASCLPCILSFHVASGSVIFFVSNGGVMSKGIY